MTTQPQTQTNPPAGRVRFGPETLALQAVQPADSQTVIRLIAYNAEELIDREVSDPSDLDLTDTGQKVNWIHIIGAPQVKYLVSLTKNLDMTREELDLVVGTHDTARVEEFPNGLFFSFSMVCEEEVLEIEQINVFLGRNFVITTQHTQPHCFDKTVKKLKNSTHKLRSAGADQLVCKLVEEGVESFIPVLKESSNDFEGLQHRVIKDPGTDELSLIHRSKRGAVILWKAVWPLNTVIKKLVRTRHPLLTAATLNELADCSEEADFAMKLTESYRELAQDLMDLYVSSLSLRTNEATTALTLIATIFLPPTLIAGIYGMNFDIPEIHFPYGYPICLLAMLLVSAGVVFWLKKSGYFKL